uniref:EF-hand domain-containing protein n=1 Tax=Helicotheca tamesis TaxID=374047 RepID=A0A7S2E0M5_9STRA
MAYGETIPLTSGSGANTGGINTETVKKVAENVLTRENAEKAKTFVVGQVDKLKTMASDGDLSLRFLAYLGGIAMVVTSILGLLGRILTFKIIHIVFDIYTIFLGVLVLFLEWDGFPQKEKYDVYIKRYFHFLDFVWGRGIVYFVAGSIQFSMLSLLDLVVGGFMMALGVLYIIVGKATADKLKAVHKAVYSDHAIASKFKKADAEGTGTINVEQFGNLIKSFGMELEKRETEIAFLEIPKAKGAGDRIDLEGFKSWWTKSDSVEGGFISIA